MQPLAEDVAVSAMLGTWIPGTVIPGAGIVRYAHPQCLGENSFYLIGGVAGGAIVTTNRRYDAGTNSWALLAPLPIGGEGPTGVCFNGKIYVAGGSAAALTAFQIYDIATNTWTAGPALQRATVMAHMGAHNGRIYVIGGDNDFQPAGGVSNVVNIYDIATNAWLAAPGAPMPTGAVSGGFAQLGTFLYIVGGWGIASPGTNVALSQRYDMATNTWTTGPAFTTARGDLAVSATAAALYAIGGDNNGGGFFDAAVTVERLDVALWPAGAWTAGDALPGGRTGHKGGYCTRSFFPATGEIWSTGGITTPFPTFTTTNQYLQTEACPSAVSVVPTALEVDPAPAGNRVLEPNQAAVIVAPSWRNTGGLAIANLTGAATNFVGPAGATYTIDDAAATYGPVAAGATSTCTGANCYAVTVTAATRPVTHWDSTITETVTPTSTVKNWTLHIGASFTDVPTTNNFYRFIESILHKNVTGGCTADTYCPAASTTREQMAVFVLVSKEPAGYVPVACGATPAFPDVPVSSGFCRWVEELARRGVVSGCGGGNYCPSASATREQMAVFVLRTLDPALNPPACAPPNLFLDVPETNGFCRWIEELANRGVVTGCGGGNYCPTADVTREQMSVFLAVTFSIALYGV